MDNELGYLKDYGSFIMSGCLVLWGLIYTFLSNDYDIKETHDIMSERDLK
jgi:hypothetical protein